jgi:hydroxysqualene synthase
MSMPPTPPRQSPPHSASAVPSSTIPITHYENFPVASILCPAHLRAPIAAIYHFARTADDIADEGTAAAAQRLADLAEYRQDLTGTQNPASPTPSSTISPTLSPATSNRWPLVFTPLQTAIRQFHLPLHLLHHLLDAFEQDIRKTADGSGYANPTQLLDYCSLSANPVGRLLLHLYGVQDNLALQRSDAICSALQLINFWQDLGQDLQRGRFYVPQDALAAAGLRQADLLAAKQADATPNEITQIIASQVHAARALMLSGAPLVHQLPGRAGWELRLVVQGGLRIADRIAALNYATLVQRPTLRPWDYAVMLWRALWM